jgi:hypothetical protein
MGTGRRGPGFEGMAISQVSTTELTAKKLHDSRTGFILYVPIWETRAVRSRGHQRDALYKTRLFIYAKLGRSWSGATTLSHRLIGVHAVLFAKEPME